MHVKKLHILNINNCNYCKEMKDQTNVNKILHSSAIYIQSMEITRSLCKKVINDQKCQHVFRLTRLAADHMRSKQRVRLKCLIKKKIQMYTIT